VKGTGAEPETLPRDPRSCRVLRGSARVSPVRAMAGSGRHSADGGLKSAEGEELVRLCRENKLALAFALGGPIRPLLVLELKY